MSFYEVQFPPEISVGSSGGPKYDTEVVTFVSGYEQRNINWSVARGEYDVSHNIKSQTALDALLIFFRAMRGKAHGFRFKDWVDYQVTTAQGVLGAGVGTGLPTYQMGKNYTLAGANTELREIKKPVAGSSALLRNGGAVTLGAGAGNAAIATATGIVTFVADSSSTVSAFTAGATTSVTLTAALPQLAIGEKLYVTGWVGTAATVMNSIAHTITNITGAGLNVYTLSTNTTGLTRTSGGTGFAYPQAGETLTWSGQFDVPCRFDIDHMKTNIIFYQAYSWGGIPIVEIRV